MKSEKAVCFRVRHAEGKSVLQCVDRASEYIPEVARRKEDKELVLEMEREGVYRVYPYESRIVPSRIGEFKGREVRLKRGFKPYKVAITMVVGRVESKPLIIEVPPIEPPKPPPPSALKFIKKEGKLYLYWSHPDEGVRFEVYRNGQLLTQEAIIQNLYVDNVPERETLYEVIAVSEDGARSEPARVIYKP